MTTQAPRLGQRACPVHEGTARQCKATVRPGHLMCPRHWREVPTDVRTLVWQTWRGWNRSHSDDVWAQYMEARQTALDYFTQLDAGRAETPSEGLTWPELDDAALVLVVAVDGTSRMWFGGDRDAAARVLHTVYGDLSKDPVTDGHPT